MGEDSETTQFHGKSCHAKEEKGSKETENYKI